MKKAYFIIILLSISSVGFFGCKKDKEEELVADFTYTTIANGGVEVTFTGKGSPYWDFGGEGVQVGPRSNTVKFYYKTNGTYNIKSTAKNSSGANGTDKSQSVTISGVPTQVKITAIKLKDFRDNNNAGNPWDSDLSGPDIKFVYFDIASGEIDLTSTFPNLQHSQLPISNTLSTPVTVNIATTSGFSVYCIDDDYTNESVEGVNMVLESHTAKAQTCDGTFGCSQTIYPTTFSSFSNDYTKMEITLEWLP